MSNNKQSSVEWLWDKLVNKPLKISDLVKLLEQAKAMHKEEMIEFCYSWSHERADKIDIDQDYNETFGGNK
jgi:hypothetical protein